MSDGCGGGMSSIGGDLGGMGTAGSCDGGMTAVECCEVEVVEYAEIEDPLTVSLGMSFDGIDSTPVFDESDNPGGVPPGNASQAEPANPEPEPGDPYAEAAVFVGATSLSLGGSESTAVFEEPETVPPDDGGDDISKTPGRVGGNAGVIVFE